MRILYSCLAFLLACWLSMPVALGQTSVDAAEKPVMENPTTLSPEALQLADQLGLTATIARLQSMQGLQGDVYELERLRLKQRIIQTVLVAMLQVRGTSAQIAYEVFEAGQMLNRLSARRDRAIKYNTIANLVTGGVSETLGGALQLVPNQQIDAAGNLAELVGGAVQTGLSGLALKQQAGGHPKVSAQPNMLAPIFDKKTDSDSRYPRVVWNYLESIPPGETQSRRVLMIKQWREYDRLPSSASGSWRIATLTGSGTPRQEVTIDLLQDRQALLTDLTAFIQQIDKRLLEIMLFTDMPI